MLSKGMSAGQEAIIGDRHTGQTFVIAKDGVKFFMGKQPIEMTAVDQDSFLGKCLTNLIARNHYLQLQGIHSGGRLVNIELDEMLKCRQTALSEPAAPSRCPQ